MYDRFFAFGCSFTSFYWPTWADIIGNEFSEEQYFNSGLCATGNEFAFHRLTEIHARYKITERDLVVICWTNFAREDRYRNSKWQEAGNIFTQSVYPKEWVKEWFDLRGALLKTSSSIAGATHLLDSTGCEYHFTSMMPMRHINQQDEIFAGTEYDDIFKVYEPYYDKIKVSMAEHLFNSLPVCRNPKPPIVKYQEKHKESYPDHHPVPGQHLQYVNDILLPAFRHPIEISTQTKDWVAEWDNKIYSAKPHFKCSEDGWSIAHTYKKNHGHLC